MRKNLEPATCLIMFERTTKCAPCAKLGAKETDSSFYRTAPFVKKSLLIRGIPDMPVASCSGGDRDIFLGQLGSLFFFRPVGIVSEKMSFKVGFEQSIETVDIMTVTRNLNNTGDTTLRSKKQVLTDTVEPTFQRGAVAPSGEAS